MSGRPVQGDHPIDGTRSRWIGRDVTKMQYLGSTMMSQLAADLREDDRRRAAIARRTAADEAERHDAPEHPAPAPAGRPRVATRRWLARLGLSGT